jgi:hypothetical protein
MWITCLLFDNLFILCYTLFEIKKEVPIPLSTLQFKAIEGGVPEIFTPLLEYCDARNVTIRFGDIYI